MSDSIGAKESDTGLAPPSQWNLDQDSKRAKGKSYMVHSSSCIDSRLPNAYKRSQPKRKNPPS